MLIGILSLGGLGLVAAICLGIASKVFYVYVDPKVIQVEDALAGANCGGCGYPGCSAAAEAIVAGRMEPNGCVAGGEEVAVRVAPISRRAASEMIESLRGAGMLKGARGHKPSDIQSVIEALLRLSQLLVDFPEIKELDINPLRVFHEQGGCRALDARMILAN